MKGKVLKLLLVCVLCIAFAVVLGFIIQYFKNN